MVSRPKILVVDDEQGIRDTLYYNLTDCGYEVMTAKNGKEALEIIKNNKFKVILSDIVMDDGDGIMLLKELKILSKFLPVILFTGYASMESTIEALNFKAYAYLKKPVLIEELKNVISKAISESEVEVKKERVFNKFLRELLKTKKEKAVKLTKDGIIENDIEIPADKRNFDKINRSITTQNSNKKAGILIITRNKVIKNNLINLLEFEDFENYAWTEKFISEYAINFPVIIIDLDFYKKKFFTEFNRLYELNPEIKIILMLNKNDKEFELRLKDTGIKNILIKPVGFDKIMEIIFWQTYLYKSDEIEKIIEKMNFGARLKSSLAYYFHKRIDLNLYVYVVIISFLIGVFIFNPYSATFFHKISNYIFGNGNYNSLPEKALNINKMYEELKGYLDRDEKRELKRTNNSGRAD